MTSSYNFEVHLQRLGAFVICLIVSLGGIPATAHENPPSIVTITVSEEGKVRLDLKIDVEAYLAESGHSHDKTSTSANAAKYEVFRKMSEADLSAEFKEQSDRIADTLLLKIDSKRTLLSAVDIQIPEIGNPELPRKSTIILVAEGLYPNAMSLAWRYHPGDSVIRLVKAGETKPYYSESVKAGSEAVVDLKQ